MTVQWEETVNAPEQKKNYILTAGVILDISSIIVQKYTR